MSLNLEQVKEHFKDAKEVRCLIDGEIKEVNDMEISKGSIFEQNYYFGINSRDGFKVYDNKNNQLAEIITYKDKGMKITEQQVKDLDNGSTTVRQLFPQVFDAEFEEGVWYKHKKEDYLVLKSNTDDFNFGFLGSFCVNNVPCFENKNWTKANLEEVKQRITEQLVKRGFVKGCSFTTPSGLYKKINSSGVLNFDCFNKVYKWLICIDNSAVFNNGKFATLISEPTQKEILQAKIKEIQEEIDKLQ